MHSSYKSKFLDEIMDVETVYKALKKDVPTPLSVRDIRRLLFEHGRNEINTRISQCIDILSQWNGVLKYIDRRFSVHPKNIRDHMGEDFDFEKNPYSNMEHSVHEIEIYLEIKRLLFATRHQIHMLEMIVQMQQSLRKM
jgi:predicted nuclease of restriction endonuclease-like RecB superfamily